MGFFSIDGFGRREGEVHAVHRIIDYLAERVRPPWRWAGLLKTRPPYIGACHASRIVDGGVDSQA